MNDETIDALLRQQFNGPVPDDGFAERALQQLPPRRRQVNWPLWAGLIAGVITCWLSLLACLPHIGGLHGMDGKLSSFAIALFAVVAGLSLLACCWSAAEADR